MPLERRTPDMMQLWGAQSAKLALRQVAELMGNALSLPVRYAPDEMSFRIDGQGERPRDGIQAVSGRIAAGPALEVLCKIVALPDQGRVPGAFVQRLLQVFQKFPQCPPPGGDDEGVWVEFRGQASPMGPSRESAFLSKVASLDEAARRLQADLPRITADADLEKAYETFSDYLQPVHPWEFVGTSQQQDLVDWARWNAQFLLCGCSLAVVGADTNCLQLALAVTATGLWERGLSVGWFYPSQLSPKDLLDLARQAPGIVALSATRLAWGSNPYQLATEAQSMLDSLASDGKAVVFTGSSAELQSVFHGGQGGVSDPLRPVVRRVPDMPLETLGQFALYHAARPVGGLSRTDQEELLAELLDALAPHESFMQRSVLPSLAACTVHARDQGPGAQAFPLSLVATKLTGVTETLGGLSARPRAQRPPQVQSRFLRRLTDPRLEGFLRESIWGQEAALEELVARLRTQILTRPRHQCLCYCAQGTPGTGKSESAIRVAEWLGIPYVNVDAASMSDHHTASSQLLGSGRGIVHSYQAGRLEQAAKHHEGAVIEVSDLDHAHPSVRTTLADLFLQMLDRGEAQSGTGAVFSCSSLIFAFTLNLPGGRDEQVRRGLGFTTGRTRQEVRSRVLAEIKGLLSGAFMSRVGAPILFDELGDATLATIVERAVVAAIESAAERRRAALRAVCVEQGVGAAVLGAARIPNATLGARGVAEFARAKAADAFLRLHSVGDPLRGKSLCVFVTAAGELGIRTESP